MKAIHLNLLNPLERRSTSPVRARIILPIIAGVVLTFVLAWGGFLGVQLLYAQGKVDNIRAEISAYSAKTAEIDVLKAKLQVLQANADQFEYYKHGRHTRGALLKELATAIPEGVTLTELSIPTPPDQELKRPPGSKLPPLQGPTQNVESVTLRLVGIAQTEQDVFQMMRALESNAFTGLLRVVKRASPGTNESPRVVAFRQDVPVGAPVPAEHRHVFFDVIYDLSAREFLK